MKVNVGTKNQNKVNAVRETLLSFQEFFNSNIDVCLIDVDSGVSKQPKNMEQTTQGAINRAKNAFHNCDISIGLESGLIEFPHTKSGYMDVTMCAIYDGKNFHLGGSSLFEYPKSVVDLIFAKDYEVDEAAKEAGFTENSSVGKAEGMVGLLTKGRLNRKDYSKQAVLTALIHLLNPEHY